jgi:uncharacterized protein (DUF924 family)
MSVSPELPESAWTAAIDRFWFEECGPARWFAPDAALDSTIRERFGPWWAALQRELAGREPETPSAAVAAVILFDQFPRNMFRGTAQMYATDALARRIAHAALDAGWDQTLDGTHRHMLYMPFMHSEERADQALSLRLFQALGNAQVLKFAQHHHDVVMRFGRFPHRDAILGRPTSPEEAAYIAAHPF